MGTWPLRLGVQPPRPPGLAARADARAAEAQTSGSGGHYRGSNRWFKRKKERREKNRRRGDEKIRVYFEYVIIFIYYKDIKNSFTASLVKLC